MHRHSISYIATSLFGIITLMNTRQCHMYVMQGAHLEQKHNSGNDTTSCVAISVLIQHRNMGNDS